MEITTADVVHLYQVRAALEQLAIRLVIDEGKAEAAVRELEQIVKAMAIAGKSNDLAGVAEQEWRFHETICELSGNPLLARIYQTISAQFRMVVALDNSRRLADLSEVAGVHRPLVDAVRRRDLVGASEGIRDHILRSLPMLLDRLRASAANSTVIDQSRSDQTCAGEVPNTHRS
jgi:DNA-binding GntR family transcriptional regulator